MKSIPISATNSSIIVRGFQISPVTNPTYSLFFKDLNNNVIVETFGIDLNDNPLVYNEFLIDNTVLGLKGGQHYLDVKVNDDLVWSGIIDIVDDESWDVDSSVPTYTYD
jgi:hypothetical protein